jgi:DNA-binding response OmpR family regulator
VNQLNLLHVEDSPSDTMLMRLQLNDVQEFSFAIDTASSLADALHALSEKSFDAILLDLGLPDSFGMDTLNRIKEQSHEIPIIVVTGTDDRDVLSEALHNGADNYLIKDKIEGNRVAIAILSAKLKRAEHRDHD